MLEALSPDSKTLEALSTDSETLEALSTDSKTLQSALGPCCPSPPSRPHTLIPHFLCTAPGPCRSSPSSRPSSRQCPGRGRPREKIPGSKSTSFSKAMFASAGESIPPGLGFVAWGSAMRATLASASAWYPPYLVILALALSAEGPECCAHVGLCW